MIDSVALLALVLTLSLTAYALLAGADYGGGVWDLLASGRTAERQRATIAHARWRCKPAGKSSNW